MVKRNEEATRIYKTMLDRHTTLHGEPDDGMKRYLWDQAKNLVEEQRLKLYYGVMGVQQVVGQELIGRAYAHSHVKKVPWPMWVAVQWRSGWQPEYPAERQRIMDEHG